MLLNNGMFDLMPLASGAQIHKEGRVELLDFMPRMVKPGTTLDHAVCDAARISYGSDAKAHSDKENRGLIRYLMSHRHTTPFEMVETKWRHVLPIFVARQLIRHRMVSVNEYSLRYKPAPDRFFIPELASVQGQSKSNKQGSEGALPLEDVEAFLDDCERTAERSFKEYEANLEAGVSRELARINLPLSLYTEWVWKIDLHNLLHFLGLRCDTHAQPEIRAYADAMYRMLAPIAPWTFEAFEDFHPLRQGMLLSSLEVEALGKMLAPSPFDGGLNERATQREQDTWKLKLAKIRNKIG